MEFDVIRMKQALRLNSGHKDKLMKSVLDRVFKADIKLVSLSGKGNGVKYGVPQEVQIAMLGKIEFYYFISHINTNIIICTEVILIL